MDDCYSELSRNGDPLEELLSVVPWCSFRSRLETALRRDKKNATVGGRPPFDAVLMFKNSKSSCHLNDKSFKVHRINP